MTTQEQNQYSSKNDFNHELWCYEKILAHSIKDVMADICLMDASFIVSQVCKDRHANIEELISSSTELFFKEGTLSYGHSAEIDLEWGKLPVIALDMEFANPIATCFFKLVLHSFYIGVSIQRVLLSNRTGDKDLDTKLFADALANARIIPLESRIFS